MVRNYSDIGLPKQKPPQQHSRSSLFPRYLRCNQQIGWKKSTSLCSSATNPLLLAALRLTPAKSRAVMLHLKDTSLSPHLPCSQQRSIAVNHIPWLMNMPQVNQQMTCHTHSKCMGAETHSSATPPPPPPDCTEQCPKGKHVHLDWVNNLPRTTFVDPMAATDAHSSQLISGIIPLASSIPLVVSTLP